MIPPCMGHALTCRLIPASSLPLIRVWMPVSMLVGHLTRMCPFLDEGRAPTDRAVSASTGAAQSVTALAAARASHSPFPAPLKRCRMAGPVVRGGFQPRDDLLRGVWILTRQPFRVEAGHQLCDRIVGLTPRGVGRTLVGRAVRHGKQYLGSRHVAGRLTARARNASQYVALLFCQCSQSILPVAGHRCRLRSPKLSPLYHLLPK